MSKTNGPQVWERFYNLLTPIYGPCLIAGGSPRDWTINKNLYPKDIDVFVAAEDEFNLELTIPDLRDAGFTEPYLKQGDTDYQGRIEFESNVVAVIEGFLDGYHTLNVIGKKPETMADPSKLMADFDHSLCRAWVDPKSFEVQLTPEFQKTLDTGIITLYNSGKEDRERTMRRINRMFKRGASYDRFSIEGEPPRGEEKKKAKKSAKQFLAEFGGIRPDQQAIVDDIPVLDIEALRNRPMRFAAVEGQRFA